MKEEEEKYEISNQTPEQKNEKRKKKKRRGKTLSTGDNDQTPENALPTVSSIITGEGDIKLPIDDAPKKIDEQNNEDEQNIQQGRPTRLRGRRKDQKEKENIEEKKEEITNLYNISNQTKPMNEQITYKPEDDFPESNNIEQIDENEKKNLRKDMNKFFKRAQIVDDEENGNKGNNGTIPSKEIDPNELFIV